MISAESALIDLQNVELEVFKPVATRILKPINLQLKAATSVAIVGPSGAGKTSLAAIIGGLIAPTAGSYLFQGEKVHTLSTRGYARFREQNVGFVFQLANLIDERTALQNVAVGITDTNVAKQQVIDRCMSALAAVGLEKIVDREAALLSGGERQRVAIARALVKNPRLIIADEPTGALDQKTGTSVLELLCELPKRGSTLVLVTHNEKAAEMMAEHVEILDGEISMDSSAVNERAGV